MTSLEILFLVLFILSLAIAIIAIINAIKTDIDIKHSEAEAQLLKEVMSVNTEMLKLLLEKEKLKQGEEDE